MKRRSCHLSRGRLGVLPGPDDQTSAYGCAVFGPAEALNAILVACGLHHEH